MKDMPYFPFWARDWRSSDTVRLMPLAARGAFVDLLAASWLSSDEEPCSIPDDDRAIATILSVPLRDWKTVSKWVRNEFETLPNRRLRNEKLYAEWQRVMQQKEKLSQSGKRGATKRWESAPPVPPDSPANGVANGVANGQAYGETMAFSEADTDTERTTTTSKASRVRASRSAGEPPAPNWCANLAAVWRDLVGRAKEGQVGALLKPFHDQHGERVLALAMRLWVAKQNDAGRGRKLAWFADEAAEYCRRATALIEQPVVDGWMSPELELLTRPPKAA